MIRPGGAHAPSIVLPLAYLVLATSAFVVATLALPWLAPELAGHYYHPRLFALTHIVTLGWISLTIMGASYQLIPIMLERRVWSERLAWVTLVVFLVGIVGVVAHFAIVHWWGFVWSAGLVALAALLHVANAGATLAGGRRSSFTARMMALALVGFGLTVLFGAVLGAHKLWPFVPGAVFPTLHAHVHLALLGWVLPTVLGVAARVYPMFLLAAEPTARATRAQGAGVAFGTPAVVVGLLIQARPLVVFGALALAVAIAVHVACVFAMARRRKRPRLDWGLSFVLAGAAALVPATTLGLALAADLVSGPRAALAYGVLVLGGWASLTIVGMMLKIVPFLVWYRAYASLVGRAAVPTLAQMSSARSEGAAFVLLVAGIGLLVVGTATGEVVAIRWAGVIAALGALAFAATLARVLHHLMPCPLRARIAAASLRATS